MVWKLVIGDTIALKEYLYYFKVTDIRYNDVVLENCLTHEYKEMKLDYLLKNAKIIRRDD